MTCNHNYDVTSGRPMQKRYHLEDSEKFSKCPCCLQAYVKHLEQVITKCAEVQQEKVKMLEQGEGGTLNKHTGHFSGCASFEGGPCTCSLGNVKGD